MRIYGYDKSFWDLWAYNWQVQGTIILRYFARLSGHLEVIMQSQSHQDTSAGLKTFVPEWWSPGLIRSEVEAPIHSTRAPPSPAAAACMQRGRYCSESWCQWSEELEDLSEQPRSGGLVTEVAATLLSILTLTINYIHIDKYAIIFD